jgi:hypothetical protein
MAYGLGAQAVSQLSPHRWEPDFPRPPTTTEDDHRGRDPANSLPLK